MLISLFLPLIILGFLSNDVAGSFSNFPWTALFVWIYLSAYFIWFFIPVKLEKLTLEGDFNKLISFQDRLPWFFSILILLLQIFVDPTKLFLPGMGNRFPQTIPLIFSACFYLLFLWLSSSCFHKAFQKLLFWQQTPNEYFRARASIPILLFPPLLIGAFLEDTLSSIIIIPGLSDLPLIVLAPIFCLILYLLSPNLFNVAWQATSLDEGSPLSRDIKALAEKTGVKIAGVKIWNTFGEPIPNAAVVGLLDSFRYVYLTRFLVDTFTPEEQMIIVAHELGHFALGHVWTYMAFTLNLVGITLALRLSIFLYVPNLSETVGSIGITIGEMAIFLVIFLVVFTAISRCSEIQADQFSVSLLDKKYFVLTMDRLKRFIGTPSRKFPWWMETHPEIQKRVDSVQNFNGDIATIGRQARNIRMIMLGLLGISIVAIFPFLPILFEFHCLSFSSKEEPGAQFFQRVMELRKKIGDHPALEEITIKNCFSRGDWATAVFGCFSAFAGTPVLNQINPELEVFHHPVSPEIAFYFNFVEFLLKFFDFRAIHGVPFFYESFNFIQVFFCP
ncbi:MAG: M48 family metalloprotease [Candidatus Riflebacteria bacterium]|nr:M48 family metalloprotease [Candidatus Riflebacteria bacterium]